MMDGNHDEEDQANLHVHLQFIITPTLHVQKVTQSALSGSASKRVPRLWPPM
jgi:hypothetical protein